ncbi:MAG TPA: CapA family protein [Micromonosporaceae bacterium]
MRTFPRRRTLPVLLGALVAVAAGGCGSPAGGGAPNGTGAATTSAAPASPSAPPRDITLEFAGDVHFTQRTAALLKDPATAFGPVATVLSQADLAMVNLETAVTERGTPQPKEFHFRAPASAYQAIKAAGVDVVTVANNHVLDYGQVGLQDTIDNAKAAGVPIVGVGRNASEAYAPWYTEIRGTKIAILAVSQVHELESTWKALDNRPGEAMASNVTRAAAAVAEARKHADVVIMYVHWGHEGDQCPTSEMKTFAAKMAAAGADIVLGTHAHLLLGDGWLGKTYVQYGLGNFLWWWDDAFSNDTGVLRITLHDKKIAKTELIPAEISRRTGQPIPSTGAEAARIEKKYTGLHACTGLAAQPKS